MIPIASSYRIIKNTGSREESECLLSLLDASAFQPKVVSVRRDQAMGIYNEEEENAEAIAALNQEMEEERTKRIQALEEELLLLREEAHLQGYEKGLEEGRAQGLEEGRRGAMALRNDAMDLLKEAEREANAFLEAEEERILVLATRIAERIVHRTLEDKEAIMELARPVLLEFGKAERVVVSASPDCVDTLRAHGEELKSLCPNAQILVLMDRSLEKNGIVLENENQIVDLQLKHQLQRFIELAKQPENAS